MTLPGAGIAVPGRGQLVPSSFVLKLYNNNLASQPWALASGDGDLVIRIRERVLSVVELC